MSSKLLSLCAILLLCMAMLPAVSAAETWNVIALRSDNEAPKVGERFTVLYEETKGINTKSSQRTHGKSTGQAFTRILIKAFLRSIWRELWYNGKMRLV